MIWGCVLECAGRESWLAGGLYLATVFRIEEFQGGGNGACEQLSSFL